MARNTKEYRNWRISVIRRDVRCVVCNTIKNRHAHHIEDYSYHPESRYDINNGVTLCGDCHTMFHCSYKKSFRQKCTKDDWSNFLELISKLKKKIV